MNQSASILVLLVLAVIAANAPFMSHKLFFVYAFDHQKKSFGIRVLELIAYYCFVGLIAYLIEGRYGVVQSQRWEFFAATACVFAVLAVPGFVYCYLWPKTPGV